MSKFNPTACVFPRLGPAQKHVLNLMISGWTLQRWPKSGCWIVEPGMRDGGRMSKALYDVIIKKFKEYFAESEEWLLTVPVTVWRFRPDLITDETRALLA